MASKRSIRVISFPSQFPQQHGQWLGEWQHKGLCPTFHSNVLLRRLQLQDRWRTKKAACHNQVPTSPPAAVHRRPRSQFQQFAVSFFRCHSKLIHCFEPLSFVGNGAAHPICMIISCPSHQISSRNFGDCCNPALITCTRGSSAVNVRCVSRNPATSSRYRMHHTGSSLNACHFVAATTSARSRCPLTWHAQQAWRRQVRMLTQQLVQG